MRTIPLRTVANNIEQFEVIENAEQQQHSNTAGSTTATATAPTSAPPKPLTRVNWRRVLAISSLILALILISGSIYLHLRQKPHLGRLHHERRLQPTSGDAPATASTSDSASFPSTSSLSAPSLSSASSSNSSSGAASMESMEAPAPASKWHSAHVNSRARHITEACMQCICETATQCRPARCGNNVDCGVFRISRPYWLDAGKPTLEGDDASNNKDGNIHYDHCVNNVYCAARIVAAYVSKYARDCNRDGRIECRDHIALHLLGPGGCVEGDLPPVFETRMEDCLANFE